MRWFFVLLSVSFAIQVGASPALAWTWPVDGPVVQQFRFGADPYEAGQHRGIDVGAPSGTPVRAPAAGTVSFAGTVPGGGLTITIETADGLSVTLVHLGSVVVDLAERVVEGETVGTIGPSGSPELPEPYVHLGIRSTPDANGYFDPLSFLEPRSDSPAPASVPAEETPARLPDPETADPPQLDAGPGSPAEATLEAVSAPFSAGELAPASQSAPVVGVWEEPAAAVPSNEPATKRSRDQALDPGRPAKETAPATAAISPERERAGAQRRRRAQRVDEEAPVASQQPGSAAPEAEATATATRTTPAGGAEAAIPATTGPGAERSSLSRRLEPPGLTLALSGPRRPADVSALRPAAGRQGIGSPVPARRDAPERVGSVTADSEAKTSRPAALPGDLRVIGIALAGLLSALGAASLLRRKLFDLAAPDAAVPVRLDCASARAIDAGVAPPRKRHRLAAEQELELILLARTEAFARVDRDHDGLELVDPAIDSRPHRPRLARHRSRRQPPARSVRRTRGRGVRVR